METFYRALNSNIKSLVDSRVGGAFMALNFVNVTMILDSFTRTCRAWHTRDSQEASNMYSLSILVEYTEENISITNT